MNRLLSRNACEVGKHTACTGDAGWDDDTQTVLECECTCHPWVRP